MIRFRNLQVLLAFALLLSSCKGIHDITFTGVSDFKLKGMAANQVNFDARVGVHNPSTMSFKVSEVNLKTSIDGNFIGTLMSDDRVKIPARSDSFYFMSFSLQMANLLTGASTLYGLSHKKQVNVEMQGYVKARSWFTSKKVIIHETRLIDVPSINR
jgi:LEA14-like dessication related protein